MAYPQINREPFFANFEALGQVGRQADGIVHRVVYRPADRAARQWLKARLVALGLSPTDDAAGNTCALPTGQAPLPPNRIGSHTDARRQPLGRPRESGGGTR